MNEQMQRQGAEKRIKATSRPRYIVGLDAHSRKQAISVWECTDPWNPVLHKERPKCDISKLKDYYEKNVPPDSITIIDAFVWTPSPEPSLPHRPWSRGLGCSKKFAVPEVVSSSPKYLI